MEAARTRLLQEGHNGVSTRKVADTAGVPLSQLHYHFGSKQGLLLAVLEEENRRRLERQARMYSTDRPLWERYEQACDFLEDDLDSGYVRVLQEMIAEGWVNPEIGAEVRRLLAGGTSCSPRSPSRPRGGSAGWGPSPPARWPRSSAVPSWGRRR